MADPISQRQARNLAVANGPERRPLVKVAFDVSNVVGLAGTLVTMGVGWGVLTLAQGDAVTGLLGLVPGVVTGITSVLAAFGVVRRGEPLVTPVSDPRDDSGRALRPASPYAS